jgi:hypothetical protein
MMVDLDDDAEWSTKDTIEDEEDDRFELFIVGIFPLRNFFCFVVMLLLVKVH